MLDRAGFQLIAVETALPFHIVAVARVDTGVAGNSAFLADDGRLATRASSVATALPR